MELLFFLILCLLGVASGVYITYSGLFKGKGVALPKKGHLGPFVMMKEGQGWIFALVGIGWTIIWVVLTAFALSTMLGWSW